MITISTCSLGFDTFGILFAKTTLTHMCLQEAAQSTLGAFGLSCAGSIFQNTRGFSQRVFAFTASYFFAFIVELKAAMFSIKKASVCEWSNLWLESDSTFVVHLFK